MKKIPLLCLRLFLVGTTLVVAVILILSADESAFGAPSLAESQQLKKRVVALEIDEQYLAAFAAATERLKLNVPPADGNRDEFLDALTDLTIGAVSSGQLSLADQLSLVLIRKSKEYVGVRDLRTATAWRIQAGIARSLGRTNEAWSASDESRCVLESVGETQSEEYSKWMWGTGNWYRRRDNNASLAYLRNAVELRQELITKPDKDTADMMMWVGWTYLHLGRHDEARRYLQEARNEFAASGLAESPDQVPILNSLGDLAALDGDWARAETYYRQATTLAEIGWKRNAINRSVPLSGYNMMAFAQLKQGKYDEAWRSLQRFRAGQAMRASVGAASWRVDKDAEYERVRAMDERLAHDRSSAQAAAESPHVTPETWKALINQLELTAEYLRAESDYLLKHPVPDVSPRELQSKLHANTAYVGWLDAKVADQLNASTGPFLHARWMYVATHSSPVRWIPVWETTTREADAEIQNPVADWQRTMARAAQWRERLDDDAELADRSRKMYREVFGTNELELPGIARLIAEVACYDEWIQTDALISPNGKYLSDRYAISYSPSAAVYVALAQSAQPKHGKMSILAIGDPSFAPSSNDLLTSRSDTRIDEVELRDAVNRDAAALDKLPRLPYSGRELDGIKALFPESRVLRGNDADEATLNMLASKDELETYDIVHIASHALVSRAPERCAIALSRHNVDGSVSNDGLVDATEIRMGWKLNAELVTLSACQTAGLAINRGEPVGFAQPLFQAGARCVLLSSWKVDDEATSLLMARFYQDVAAQKRDRPSFSDALADAKNWLRNYRDVSGRRPFAHPVYWSGFVLIGDAN